ncbi:MAG TPA: universal stress protein [Polyangiales bacterium]|nr:universal stress protein [Polyangiales bacterium]
MAIIVGIDFSDHSAQAAKAAAHLAVRTGQALHLVHVAEPQSNEPLERLRELLEQKAAMLRATASAITVTAHVEPGLPDDVLLSIAARLQATLLVVAALGMQSRGEVGLGQHADRLAQHAHLPLLVVRDSAAFDGWARATRPLGVLLGADFTLSSKHALAWVDALRAGGPCELEAVHLYWPPAEFLRLGLTGVRSYTEPDPEVTRALGLELSAHLSGLAAPNVRLRLEPHLGSLGERLAALSAEEHVDLVVVGSHERSLRRSLWRASTSRTVLQRASTNVVCVPAPKHTRIEAARSFRNVLVATDFSEVGNAGIALAYRAAEHGGVVHVVHVAKDRGHFPTDPHDIFVPEPAYEEPQLKLARERLAELVHGAPLAEHRVTRLYVLESNHVAEAIAQAAERLAADLICIGTHGRSGLAKLALGSVTQDLLTRTSKPILLSRKPVE